MTNREPIRELDHVKYARIVPTMWKALVSFLSCFRYGSTQTIASDVVKSNVAMPMAEDRSIDI